MVKKLLSTVHTAHSAPDDTTQLAMKETQAMMETLVPI